MKIIFYPITGFSEKGRRNNNEDCIYPNLVDIERGIHSNLFIVCDGVGGASYGEMASAIVCDTLSEKLSADDAIDGEKIQAGVTKAVERIEEYSNQYPGARGMATTMTLLATDQKSIFLAHIGDSRIYHIRKGNIVFKTKDHSLVHELLDAGIISQEEALVHPKRNVITRAISEKGVNAEVNRVNKNKVQKGDLFFLCTDGVLEGMSEKALVKILSQPEQNNREKIEEIKELCAINAKDNYSGYLLEVSSVKKNPLNLLSDAIGLKLKK